MSRCPKEMAEIGEGGPYCIDRWEAHLEVRAPEGEGWLPHSPYQSVDRLAAPYRAVSAPGFVPQGYISGAQAKNACSAAGKRLCSRREHLLACRGPQKTLYPYGNEYTPKACNEGRRSHPVAALFGALASPAVLWGKGLNDPRVNQQADSLRPAGETPGCVSAYGVYDLVGNLHEWVDDGRPVFAGGYYVDAELNGSGCTYTTRAHGGDYHDYSTGFRCCL
ncbi:MAG TPA: SUMF1/EgtB/PvdO family nonheme iron enzyme [Polyangiaceae bacterium]|nr:SUMF1/EgtB/PvdO family nonheme iron enzyme [Polyangiaceae bacterium]